MSVEPQGVKLLVTAPLEGSGQFAGIDTAAEKLMALQSRLNQLTASLSGNANKTAAEYKRLFQDLAKSQGQKVGRLGMDEMAKAAGWDPAAWRHAIAQVEADVGKGSAHLKQLARDAFKTLGIKGQLVNRSNISAAS